MRTNYILRRDLTRHTARRERSEFAVEQEDSVYPMVAAGSALHEMIRRPDNPMIETAEDA